MPQATLRTDRLELVPLAEDHLEHEVELDSDPEVLRYLLPRPRTREQVVTQHAWRVAQAGVVDGLGLWAGFLRGEPERFVGLWMLQPPHGPSQQFVAREADLGYRLLRRWWRQGYGSEGSRALLRYGFEDLGLARIFAQTMTVNRASRATMEKLGMRYVRTFHEDHDEPLPGTEEGEVEYELLRADWLAGARPRP
ncbi:MAG: GNAT family N-acetyltransferase [Thermocrispum sp.]